jgi:hypothetical protein
MAQWWRRIFRDDVKTHYYPITLEARLMENWTARGFKLHPGTEGDPADWVWSDVSEGSLSLGHSGFTDETWEVFRLPGLALSIRAREVEDYLVRLEEAPVRLEIKRRYFKLHGFSECLCMLPQHRDRLLVQLKAGLTKANAIAAAEAVDFNRRLEEMSEHPNLKVDQRLPEKKRMGRA